MQGAASAGARKVVRARRRGRVAATSACVFVALTALVASACSDTGGGAATATTSPTTGAPVLDAPPLTATQQAALHRLATPDATGLVDAPETQGHEAMHGMHGMAHPSSGASSPELRRQLASARRAARVLSKQSSLAASGYFLGSYYSAGIGTHYIDWQRVGTAFDPARPAMLLVDTTPGHARRLAGFSYWVRSTEAPAGFAGADDVWHVHRGLCFVDGVLMGEDVPMPRQCKGDWIDGHDLWMLHAWVVPGYPNADGVFAPTNPLLCPPRQGIDAGFC